MATPNIVWVHSDQHHPRVAGYAGDRVVRTPAMDRLAAEGVALDACYCPSPVCVPSRMSTLAGLLPAETRVYGNSECLPSDMATFVHCLGLAGYDTVLCGRMHFVGPDQRHGYRRRIFPDITGTQVGYNAHAFGPGWLGTTGGTRFAVDRSGPGHTAVLDYDRAVTDRACAFLAEPHDAPFFLTVGTYGPHCPYVCPRDLFDDYYDRVPMPAVPEDFPATAHPVIAQMVADRGMLDTPAEAIRRARAAYYGLVELTDQYLGAVLAALEAHGLRENTVVIYTSDHGDMLGEFGMFAKHTMYEASVGVPAIFSWPGHFPAGRIGQPTSLLDLGPTLIELAGAPALPRAHGQSLLGLLRGEAPENPDRPVFAQIRLGAVFAMVRKGPWKLVAYHQHRPQLFNLADDPHELRDLGDDPAHADVRAALAAELATVWDGEQMAQAIARSGRHTSLIAQFNRLDGVDDPAEAWYGDPARNYLEDADVS